MEIFFEPTFWTVCQSRFEIKENIEYFSFSIKDILYNSYDKKKKYFEHIIFLIFFIRDKYIGYGLKDISRWMLLELDRQYDGILDLIISNLIHFGYWNDYNLILKEINKDPYYKKTEKKIYKFILESFKKDIYFYENKQYERISNLVKYIGKERKSLDKQIGFVRIFVSLLYPELSQRVALKKYRIMCSNLNKVKHIEKYKNIHKMLKDYRQKYKTTTFKDISRNPRLLFRNTYSYTNNNNRYINSICDIENIFQNNYLGKYIYNDNIIKSYNYQIKEIEENNNYYYKPIHNEVITKQPSPITLYDNKLISLKTCNNNFYDVTYKDEIYIPLLSKKSMSESDNNLDPSKYIGNILNNVVIKLSNNVEININKKKDMKYMVQYYKKLTPIEKFRVKQQLKIQRNSIIILQIFFKDNLKKKHTNSNTPSILNYIRQYWEYGSKKNTISSSQSNNNTIYNEDFVFIKQEDLI
jgi:hypothetical protein